MDEVECIVLEAAFNVVDFVLCFYNTAPSQWLGYCIVLTPATLA